MLHLLALCYRFKINQLFLFLLPLVVSMTTIDTLPNHLSEELTTQHILRLARDIECPEIAVHARAKILGELWSKNAWNIFEVLAFGIYMDNNQLVGAALYQIMIMPIAQLANNEQLLGVRQRHEDNFRLATEKCILLWGTLFNSWGSQLSEELLGALWRRIAKGDLMWFDVVGKFSLAKSLLLPKKKTKRSFGGGPAQNSLTPLDRKLEEIKKDMFSFFGFSSLKEIDLGGNSFETMTNASASNTTSAPSFDRKHHWTVNASRGSMILCVNQTLVPSTFTEISRCSKVLTTLFAIEDPECTAAVPKRCLCPYDRCCLPTE